MIQYNIKFQIVFYYTILFELPYNYFTFVSILITIKFLSFITLNILFKYFDYFIEHIYKDSKIFVNMYIEIVAEWEMIINEKKKKLRIFLLIIIVEMW